MTDGSFITITTIIALLVIAPSIYNQKPTGSFIRLVNHRTQPLNFIITESSAVLETITTLSGNGEASSLFFWSRSVPRITKEMCNKTHWYFYSETNLDRAETALCKKKTMDAVTSALSPSVALCPPVTNRGQVKLVLSYS